MGKNREASLDRVWEVIEQTGICMLTTRSGAGFRARPMEARPDRDEEVIWFLTDERGLKDDEIATDPHVCLVFIYPKEKVYLCVTGEAFVAHDPERARELWNEEQKAWWSGPDDPNLRVVRVEPARAEMWDGPSSSTVAAFEFAKTRVLGTKPNLGEKRKVTVDMR